MLLQVRVWGLGLRALVEPYGVSVSVVCPGFIETAMTDIVVGEREREHGLLPCVARGVPPLTSPLPAGKLPMPFRMTLPAAIEGTYRYCYYNSHACD